jgi:hypothetical protein
MLLAEARLATRFMYDYHFYHHVSSPFVQELRRSFLSQLREASPRFIIEVDTDKPWISGMDTTREFPELRGFLDDHYAVACRGDGYLVSERMGAAQSQDARRGAAPAPEAQAAPPPPPARAAAPAKPAPMPG